jgi:hypothetical protein
MRLEGEYRYRGMEEEESLLGHKLDWKNLLETNKISCEKRPFVTWQKIIQNIYPEDPTMPKKKWSKDLYNFVAEKLGLDIDDMENLKFYRTLGTDLDRMGVDCFFVFNNPITKKEADFTIDLTINPQKDEAKANMVINASGIPDYRINIEEYIAKMEEIAGQIAETLKEKTKETIH